MRAAGKMHIPGNVLEARSSALFLLKGWRGSRWIGGSQAVADDATRQAERLCCQRTLNSQWWKHTRPHTQNPRNKFTTQAHEVTAHTKILQKSPRRTPNF